MYELLAQAYQSRLRRYRAALLRVRREGPGQIQFWVIALLIGICAGVVAIAFREGIALLQTTVYGETDEQLHSHLSTLPWYWVLGIPVLGGLAVGLILWRFTPDGRGRSVAHVIEGAALGHGRVEKEAGLASAAASLITLSTGGSTGREGPVVHMAALIATKVSDWLRSSDMTARDLMGCAVAGAVSASFNAPIAGALFALEVVLRHFAIHAFAPIVVASVAGTVVSRLWSGDLPEFTLPTKELAFYIELPAFMVLGLVCGLVAVVMMKAIFWAEDIGDYIQDRLRLPIPLRPALAGVLLGLIAIQFPHIIGVGYETTNRALAGNLAFWTAVSFAVVKAAAVAITMAGRMGGGVFSPSLMLGALTGLAFGSVATAIFPDISGTEAIYALAGMGAVAAAVLGAPISTTLIVFEMTGDWQAGIAVLVAISLSSAVAVNMVDKSFFLTQLERAGRHVAAGPQDYVLCTIAAGELMRPRGAENGASDTQSWSLVEQGAFLTRSDTLEAALPMFEQIGGTMIPVVEEQENGPPELLGALFQVDALKAYNRALAEVAREEHS
ncbi:chloride channel protein [Pontivivens insulae]|uniref:H(+)/Cl(-) exchange transporter ClcA n=1 Tax=Pontivivens insulae TaxID=1639689 RepID=A0A2R8AE24_9RHOB|nr:chloride channel protein [Pontivivens insulae]RED14253.1 CIC family chloride channel protein [Pontivivens insulae]SPF30328.1 H(+)/Cl(-) exchange transporter ClcA [Pontivivens insulae]